MIVNHLLLIFMIHVGKLRGQQLKLWWFHKRIVQRKPCQKYFLRSAKKKTIKRQYIFDACFTKTNRKAVKFLLFYIFFENRLIYLYVKRGQCQFIIDFSCDIWRSSPPGRYKTVLEHLVFLLFTLYDVIVVKKTYLLIVD